MIAVGFAFLGLEMMAHGVAPLAADPGFVALIGRFDGKSFSGQLLACLTGLVLTTVMQSSSAMLFVALGFAAQGLLTIPAGIALVLGANVGTTATALIASAELDWRGRRLAVAHFLVKAVG
ncbi:MAG: Na/Pi cotransporter family protein, partial [Actinobacteria bacterium]|nr:Na/Pi cotransporter family protein [Actinomycetota bacterium]